MATNFSRLREPIVKLRKVKFTGAAGQALAVSNELQPLVVAQDLAGAATAAETELAVSDTRASTV